MSRVPFFIVFLFCAVAFAAAGCSTGDPASPLFVGAAPADAGTSSGPTYYDDVEPILHERCTRCHQPHNIAPFSLLTENDVYPKKDLIAAAIESGIMPPMPALQNQDGCPDVDDERVMPGAERDVIRRWVEGGAIVGNSKPAEPPPAGDGPLGPPTHIFESPVTYQAPADVTDDYRCFIVDPKLTASVGVSAVSVRPGTASMVHHASVYVVPPEAAGALHQLDAADPDPGYSCFGGVGTAQAYAVGLWVPGMIVHPPPRPGLGGWLLPNWLMVLQVHYNFANGRGTDQSSIVAWQSKKPIVEIPSSLILSDNTIDLPAGQKGIVRSVTGEIVSASAPAGLAQVKEGLVYAVWGHEHLLGKSLQMDLVHANGTSECLLSIPKWNFHWQGSYAFKTPVATKAGEQIRLTCEWDNSPENQPIVDGRRQPPHEVHFGETTEDEMCIGTLAVMQP
jgi:hypothetical protein